VKAMNAQTFQTATEHHRAGRLGQAEPLYRQVLAQEPNHADALNQLGYLLYQTGRYQEALHLIGRAIDGDPSIAEYHNNLGLALAALDLTDRAIAAYRQAAALNPDLPEIHNNLGNTLEAVGQLDQAVAAFRHALALRNDLAEVWDNLSRVLKNQGHFDEAMAVAKEAVRLRPDLASAHFNLGLLHLLMGDLQQGWAEYEWRWKFLETCVPRPLFDQTLWDGGDLAGRRILIHAEGGFGDTLHFVRFVPLVVQRGGRVIFGCPKELLRLLQGLGGIEQLVPSGQAVPEFDVQCPAASLPRALNITWANLPAHVPYLRADTVKVESWRRRLLVGEGRLKIGLVWAGRPDFANDQNRSMPLSRLAPLGGVPGTWFCSLQKGAAGQQALAGPPGLELTDWTGELDDFADSAALIANLDLVVTVDTAVAHLAGALAKPVWVLLPFVPDWRWMLQREDSPWYPTMRLFRQRRPDDWDAVIDRVVEALRGLTSQRE